MVRLGWRAGAWALGFLGLASVWAACEGGDAIVNEEKRVCAENQYRCAGDTLQLCNPVGTGFDNVSQCKPGTCSQGATSCPADTGPEVECTSGAECESGVCTGAGTCAPPEATLRGKVLRYESLKASYVSGVDARVVGDSTLSAQSGAGGEYVIEHIPPGSQLDLNLMMPDQEALVFVPPALSTRVFVSVIGEKEKTVDPPVVSFGWLSQVAVDCGVFETLEAAQKAPDGDYVNPYWTERSTLVIDVRDASGSPVEGITAADIKLKLDGYVNALGAAGDAETRVCFLEADGTELRGSSETATTAAGSFVVFRVRNEHGLGRGIAEVAVKNLPPEYVSLSAGNIGVVQLGDGDDFPPKAEVPRTFEGDVYPLFTQLGCAGCHRPGKPGYDKSKERGGLKADFFGDADAVYAVLTAGDQAGCAEGSDASARVCLESPDASLLAKKPLAEEPADHQNASFYTTDDPKYRAIVEWVKQGAKRN